MYVKYFVRSSRLPYLLVYNAHPVLYKKKGLFFYLVYNARHKFDMQVNESPNAFQYRKSKQMLRQVRKEYENLILDFG